MLIDEAHALISDCHNFSYPYLIFSYGNETRLLRRQVQRRRAVEAAHHCRDTSGDNTPSGRDKQMPQAFRLSVGAHGPKL